MVQKRQFSWLPEKWVWYTAYSVFVHVHWFRPSGIANTGDAWEWDNHNEQEKMQDNIQGNN